LEHFPKLHNAMWPGVVGKGSPGAEPFVDLDTMLDLTARAEVKGQRFDGVDLFLYDPHTDINISDDGIKKLADKVSAKGFVVGSVVAPVWFGGTTLGTEEQLAGWLESIDKSCRIARRLRDLGVRPHGVVRIDSSCSVEEWRKDPKKNTQRIAKAFQAAADIAERHGERLAAEGEICWGGMHSWRDLAELFAQVDRPQTLGFQADMAHVLLLAMGYNAEDQQALLPKNFNWQDSKALVSALKKVAEVLRPHTIDFHVAQNDATVKGSGTHDKTGRHCVPNDPNGRLDIPRDAAHWLRDANGALTKACRHICWDGCMFPNEIMLQPDLWNSVLGSMIAVRDQHGWYE
jgi:sugar phosphate isomerase/epimerase